MGTRKAADEFVERWSTYIAGSQGAIPGSLLRPLSAREEAQHRSLPGATYILQVPRGLPDSAIVTAAQAATSIAQAYNVDRSQVHIATHRASRLAGHDRCVRITIVEDGVWNPDALSDDGPQVEAGLIAGLCRDHHGTRKLPVRMWDDQGMTPTVLLGGDDSGRTTAGWQLAAAALASGATNLILVDPKGESPAALRQAARVVITGEDYAGQAEAIVGALIRHRADYAATENLDLLTPGLPGVELPAWTVLHDDVDRVHYWTSIWHKNLRTARALGIWPVVVARSNAQQAWANYDTQAVFRQTIRVPRPGHVGAPPSHQPRALDVADLDDQLGRFARAPELAAVDVEALTDLLGAPVDGRWVIGPEGTHSAYRSPASSTLVDDEFPGLMESHMPTERAASPGPRMAELMTSMRLPEPKRDLLRTHDFAFGHLILSPKAQAEAVLREMLDVVSASRDVLDRLGFGTGESYRTLRELEDSLRATVERFEAPTAGPDVPDAAAPAGDAARPARWWRRRPRR